MARTNKAGPSKDGRRRCWACVVYPQSAPADWLDSVAQWAVPCAVSPLHDKDVNPDGTPKKAHYHLMVYWEGKKSEEGAKELFDQVRGVGCIPIQSPEGYTRYLVHKDNPEKYQYNPSEIKAFGGFDVSKYLNNNADKTQTIREMQAYCRQEGITNFAVLMDYARENNDTWYTALCTYCSALMVRYLQAMEYEQEQKGQKKLKKLEDEYKAKEAEQRANIEKWAAEAKRRMIKNQEYAVKMRAFEEWQRIQEEHGYIWSDELGQYIKKE